MLFCLRITYAFIHSSMTQNVYKLHASNKHLLDESRSWQSTLSSFWLRCICIKYITVIRNSSTYMYSLNSQTPSRPIRQKRYGRYLRCRRKASCTKKSLAEYWACIPQTEFTRAQRYKDPRYHWLGTPGANPQAIGRQLILTKNNRDPQANGELTIRSPLKTSQATPVAQTQLAKRTSSRLSTLSALARETTFVNSRCPLVETSRRCR